MNYQSNMKEEIENKLKEIYGDNFILSSGPVALLNRFFEKKWVVEMSNFKLGKIQDFEKELNKLVEQYPPNLYYCIYYTSNVYKSEEAEKEFLNKFYKNGSRFPEESIPDEAVKSGDSVLIRACFYSIEKYKNLPTNFCEFYIEKYLEDIRFYKYYDDSLYIREKNILEQKYSKDNIYSLEPIDKASYYIERIGYVRDLNKNINFRKKEIEESLEDRFIKWIDNKNITINIKDDNGKINFRIIEDYEGGYISVSNKENLVENIKKSTFSSENELAEYIKKYAAFDFISFTPDQFLISKYKDHELVDTYQYNINISNSKVQPKTWEEICSIIREVKDNTI